MSFLGSVWINNFERYGLVWAWTRSNIGIQLNFFVESTNRNMRISFETNAENDDLIYNSSAVNNFLKFTTFLSSTNICEKIKIFPTP